MKANPLYSAISYIIEFSARKHEKSRVNCVSQRGLKQLFRGGNAERLREEATKGMTLLFFSIGPIDLRESSQYLITRAIENLGKIDWKAVVAVLPAVASDTQS